MFNLEKAQANAGGYNRAAEEGDMGIEIVPPAFRETLLIASIRKRSTYAFMIDVPVAFGGNLGKDLHHQDIF